MVQVRENLTVLEGEITARGPHPRLADFDDVVVRVERAAPAAGKPDLLAPATGQELHVAVRRDLLGGVAPGAHVRLRAARTSSGEAMAEPVPAPGHFSVYDEMDGISPTQARPRLRSPSTLATEHA